MRKIFISCSVAFYSLTFCQVGINTGSPKATLDVVGKPTDTSIVDGVIIPRISGNELSAKDALYSSEQTGVVIYVTSPASPTTTKTVEVTAGGLYSFNGTIWKAVASSPNSSNGWNTTGNLGTTAGTNFIGTRDNADLVFKVNNTQAGQINISLQNTAFGVGTFPTNINTTGGGNSAFGGGALATNTTGGGNSAFGSSSLAANITASGNSAFGSQALRDNTTGANNSAFGNAALRVNTEGYRNAAFGNVALALNTTGFQNSAFGYEALRSNTTGSNNSAFGEEVLRSNTTGIRNVAFGAYALYSNTDGNQNSAFGTNALYQNFSGINNVAFGYKALEMNDSSNNTSIGAFSLNNTTTGFENSALGHMALRDNTTGSFNVAVGGQALVRNVLSSNNVSIGFSAMNNIFDNSDGYNVAIGRNAYSSKNSVFSGGSRNTIIGGHAGENVTGDNNLILGFRAGQPDLDINNNTAVALSGNNNILIGTTAVLSADNASNEVRLGNTDISFASIQVPWSTTSDKRWKTDIKDSSLGLHFIKQLRPVSYIRKNDKAKKLEYGFIAQELQETLKKNGVADSGIVTEDSKTMLAVRYNDLLAPMVKAIQEQQQLIEKLQERIELLEKK